MHATVSDFKTPAIQRPGHGAASPLTGIQVLHTKDNDGGRLGVVKTVSRYCQVSSTATLAQSTRSAPNTHTCGLAWPCWACRIALAKEADQTSLPDLQQHVLQHPARRGSPVCLRRPTLCHWHGRLSSQCCGAGRSPLLPGHAHPASGPAAAARASAVEAEMCPCPRCPYPCHACRHPNLSTTRHT